MSMIIFFGGLALGFLVGWLGMACLAMASLNNQEAVQVFDEPSRPAHDGLGQHS